MGNKQEDIDRIMEELTTETGRFGRFALDNISYYPTERIIRERIGWVLYGINYGKQGLFDSEIYCDLEKRKIFTPDIHRPLAHQDVEGEFLLMSGEKGNIGLLHISRILTTHPRISPAVISEGALFPHYHQVREFGYPDAEKLYRVSFYTADEDGSEWSIHCREIGQRTWKQK